MDTVNFSHSGSIGDVIGSIPAMKEFNRQTGKKIILHLISGVKAEYYEGATHPTKDKDNVMVMLNESVIEMLKPLLLAQEFIEGVVTTTKDVKNSLRLHAIREVNVGMPYFSLNRWYFYAFPDFQCDLTKQWLTVPDSDTDLATGKIIITRTERYTQSNLNYDFLKPYEDDLIFSGTMREYNQFMMAFDLNIKKLTVNSFLDIAQAIKQSRFHISNQTMAFQISEGLRHPRMLEACLYAPNVIVFGENAYDYINQIGLEYSFHRLNGTDKEYMEGMKNKGIPQIETPL